MSNIEPLRGIVAGDGPLDLDDILSPEFRRWAEIEWARLEEEEAKNPITDEDIQKALALLDEIDAMNTTPTEPEENVSEHVREYLLARKLPVGVPTKREKRAG